MLGVQGERGEGRPGRGVGRDLPVEIHEIVDGEGEQRPKEPELEPPPGRALPGGPEDEEEEPSDQGHAHDTEIEEDLEVLVVGLADPVAAPDGLVEGIGAGERVEAYFGKQNSGVG